MSVQNASGASLVVNGGFETPTPGASTWGSFSSVQGWTMANSSNSPVFEIQQGTTGSSFEGSQYLELDSNATTSFYQDLTTIAGSSYQLSFAFSPRSGVADNTMRVWWNDVLLDTLSASGLSNGGTNWTLHNYVLNATSTTSRLKFDNLLETSNGAGSLLDAVSVNRVPEPSLLALLSLGLLALSFYRPAMMVKA